MLNYVAGLLLHSLRQPSYWRDTSSTSAGARSRRESHAEASNCRLRIVGGRPAGLPARNPGRVRALGALFADAVRVEVSVIADSPRAARYAGMRTRRKILAVMAISGAIAGIGGASQIGDFTHTLDGSPTGLQAAAFGYTGIVVAALARYNPFAVCLVAVLIGGLLNAGYTLQGPDFPSGLVGVMQGILFCALGGELLLRYRLRITRLGGEAGRGGRRPVSVNDSLLVIVLAQAIPLRHAAPVRGAGKAPGGALGRPQPRRSGDDALRRSGRFWVTQRFDGSGGPALSLAVVASALAGRRWPRSTRSS